jgi:Uma2 family endonuclease
MVTQVKPMTIAEFTAFVELPENVDRVFELINGEVVEKLPARTSNSDLRDIMAFLARLHCRDHQIPCYTSGEAGAYAIQGNTVVPDFAYKPTPMSQDYPDPTPPTWVVEIVSPTDEPTKIRDKRNIYRSAGIVYLEMYPVSREVDVYRPGQDMQTFGVDDTIDLSEVIAGFRLRLRDVFGAV